MGCCPSKPNTTSGKEYPEEGAIVVPATVKINQVELAVGNEVQEMLMDRGDGTIMDKSDDEAEDDEPVTFKMENDDTVAMALDKELVHSPVAVQASPPPSPPRKSSHCADDMPISSTYHRMHVHEMEEQEAKRQEELRLETEQREREVREFKAAMLIA
ncbi:Hypothetical protein PHPALM_9673 [Phytophthora palmivora]|uniref:Uncharacterized protein n=1 Tax=Phytophthora palmivora TaxID=4796 RepID=A0A2P4Y6P4_9STRA|nr:Hypothetical protein PHPALM_9673 [Phytophthora palmivora]